MTEKQKRNLYLFTALLCFIGIIVVFFVDGYLGVYDILYVNSMELEQTVEFESDREWKPYIHARWQEIITFKYEIDSRSFYSYSIPVEVSLWQSGKKVAELFREDVLMKAFDKRILSWELDTKQLEKPLSVDVQYTLKIKRDEVEREAIITLESVPEPYPIMPPAPSIIK